MRFQYSVIKFVPNPIRGEYVNVGIIVGSDEASEWEIRTLENLKRARCLDDGAVLPLVWAAIDDLGRKLDRFMEAIQSNLFEDVERVSEEWLHRLSVESRNVVQFSEPAIVVADNASEAIDTVFQQFVMEPVAREFRFKKKTEALAAVRRAYRAVQLPRDYLQENANVAGRNHRERFDFVVGNGSALQLTQTWSFQIPNQFDLSEKIRAWAWTVQDVRAHGGMAETMERRIHVPPEVDIEVVYIAPQRDGPRSALDEALAAFKHVRARAVEAHEAQSVAAEAFQLVQAASRRIAG